ncbi:MAG: ROK family protein [Anaerolineaceae bacterium]
MKLYIVVDVGGTNIRVASYSPASLEPVSIKKIPTQGDGLPPVDRLMNLIAELWPAQDEVHSINIAVPGPVNPYTGIIAYAPNIKGWENFPLRQILQERFPVRVNLANDANVAALGEWKFGAGKGHKDLVYMTISTGIGGGVILDNHLLLGVAGMATELGHMIIQPDGPMCGCGHRGHLESFSSGTGIAKYYNQQRAEGRSCSIPAGHKTTSKEISAAAEKGDELAIEAFTIAAKYLGIGISNYLHIFNPSIVVLGGGVTHAWSIWYEPLMQSIRENITSPRYMEGLIITRAVLGDDVGLLGGLALAQTLD